MARAVSVTRSVESARRIVRGALAGTAAYIVGYALVGLVVLVGAVASMPEDAPPLPVIVGLFWQAAHAVPVGIGVPSDQLLLDPDAPGHLRLLFVLPPLLLTAGGAVLAVLDGAADGVTGARSGAAVVVGYLPAAVLGLALFWVRTTSILAPDPHAFGASQGVLFGDLQPFGAVPHVGFLLIGLAYPLVFGSLGGSVGGLGAARRPPLSRSHPSADGSPRSFGPSTPGAPRFAVLGSVSRSGYSGTRWCLRRTCSPSRSPGSSLATSAAPTRS